MANAPEDNNGVLESAPFHRLLAHNWDVVGTIGGFLTWRDLLHVTSVSRAALASDLRREFERQSRLLVPPDPAAWTTIATRLAASSHEWTAVSVAHTALMDEVSTAFASARRVVVEPHRFMLPPRLASIVIDLTQLHGNFPRLEDLDVSGISELVDITSLATLTQLRRLNLSATGVEDLSTIACLRHLLSLDVSRTRITTLDPLRGLPELETLNLDEMKQICSLEPLEGLIRLTSLTVRRVNCENGMEQLTTIAPRLREFACCSKIFQSSRSDERYEAFGRMLRSMTGVQLLEITSHATIYIQFEDFASLTHLRRLHASVLPTSDLSPLCALVHLEELWIVSSKCVDLSALASLRELRYLYCHGGDPDSMDAIAAMSPGLELPNLKQLDASNHYLARFAKLPRLEDLNVYVWSGDTLALPIGCASQLRCFRLSGDVGLREIHTRFPDLEELALQQCFSYDPCNLLLFEKLQSLTLKDPSSGFILPAHSLPHLRVLRLHGTSVTRQPRFSSIPNLTHLDLEKTSITNLDVIESLKKLQFLNLKDTRVRDVTPLLSMPSLEKVVLPKSAQCAPLVAAYHDASRSLSLREVLHPTKSCLWGPHHRSRQKSNQEPPKIENLPLQQSGDGAIDYLAHTIEKCSIV